MKSVSILLLLSFILAGLPSRSWAAPMISAGEKAELAALYQPKLLAQSAGDGVVVIEDRRGWRRHRVEISLGAIILTGVIVTLVVLGTRGAPRP